uniref:Ras-GEF domain-containing protein n=1 Tax=Rhabditophanes sp. KR3021 TaxID=114890 RepID=A0AC35U7T6_9BILA
MLASLYTAPRSTSVAGGENYSFDSMATISPDKDTILSHSKTITVDILNSCTMNPSSTLQLGNLQLNDIELPGIICNEQGQIISATAEGLLAKLLPTRAYCPSSQFIFTFLANMRTFITADELLQKLLQHCMFELHSDLQNFKKEERAVLFDNVYVICNEWVTQIPYDFSQRKMRDRLQELLNLSAFDSKSKEKISDLMEKLKTNLDRANKYTNAIMSLEQAVEDPPQTSEQICGIMKMTLEPLVVAQQLTHIELERLSVIGVDELIQALSYGDMDKLDNGQPTAVVTSADRDFNEAPKNTVSSSIRFYISWFNQLTAFIATEIIRHSRKRYRVKAIEYFIDVAKECINIGNFNSMMAIVAALSLPAIARLKKTWIRVEKSKLEILQHQLNPSGNFISYRATLKAAVWRSENAKTKKEMMIIPFFALLLKDLFLVHQRSKLELPNNRLNYGMFSQFAEQIGSLNSWRKRDCPFKKYNSILQYLLLAPNYSEKTMLLLSYDYEIAEQGIDKAQYKKLKDETKKDSAASNDK